MRVDAGNSLAQASSRPRWWGWGDPHGRESISEHGLRHVAQTVGIATSPRPPVALSAVRLPACSLDARVLSKLREAVGEQGLSTAVTQRVLHAAGKGYLDLVRLRGGVPDGAPDAVLAPRTRSQLKAALSACEELSLGVVPFGGGTSVVGGLAPVRGGHRGVIALDLRLLTRVQALDERSLTVTADGGLKVAALEALLARKGLTLGHFPQSFEYVTLGGCAATRSAGQASSGYGRFEDMVLGLRLVSPRGELALPALPASAAGPELKRLVLGSEGTLGVIDELTLRVRKAPRHKLYEGWLFEDFAAGTEMLRALAQARCAPALAVARLSDRQETATSLAMASGQARAALLRGYARARGRDGGCLAIFGFEGDEDDVRSSRRRLRAYARAAGALPLGRAAGESWRQSRYSAPYVRDDLLTYGVLAETLETAGTWSRLHALHVGVSTAIDGALRSLGTPGVVGCHVSHVYETGASLYFTFLAQAREGEQELQWRAVKEASLAAIVAAGGTISHHHGVGRDHARWLVREIGREGVSALRALKSQLDPAGIMNPGKLLPAGAA